MLGFRLLLVFDRPDITSGRRKWQFTARLHFLTTFDILPSANPDYATILSVFPVPVCQTFLNVRQTRLQLQD